MSSSEAAKCKILEFLFALINSQHHLHHLHLSTSHVGFEGSPHQLSKQGLLFPLCWINLSTVVPLNQISSKNMSYVAQFVSLRFVLINSVQCPSFIITLKLSRDPFFWMPPEGFYNAVMRPILTAESSSSGIRACAKAWQRNQNLSQFFRIQEWAKCIVVMSEGPLAVPRPHSSDSSRATLDPIRTGLPAVLSTDLQKRCTQMGWSLGCATPRRVLSLSPTVPPSTPELLPSAPRSLAECAVWALQIHHLTKIQTDDQHLNPLVSGEIGEPLHLRILPLLGVGCTAKSVAIRETISKLGQSVLRPQPTL